MKKIIGIGMALSAIIGKRGVVKIEVINSMARQLKTLQKRDFIPFVYLFHLQKYGQPESAIAEIFSTAFQKWGMSSCLIENNFSAEQLIADVISRKFIPIVGGQLEKEDGWFPPSCNDESRFFATLCGIMHAELAVFVGDYYVCKKSREKYPCMLGNCPFVAVTHYDAEFLLKSVSLGTEVNPSFQEVMKPKIITGLPYMFY